MCRHFKALVHISQTALLGLKEEPLCHLPEPENIGCQISRAVCRWYCGGVFRTSSFVLQNNYVLVWGHKACGGVVVVNDLLSSSARVEEWTITIGSFDHDAFGYPGSTEQFIIGLPGESCLYTFAFISMGVAWLAQEILKACPKDTSFSTDSERQQFTVYTVHSTYLSTCCIFT